MKPRSADDVRPPWRVYLAEQRRVDFGARDVEDHEIAAFVAMEERLLVMPIQSVDDALAVLCAAWATIRAEKRGELIDSGDHEAAERAVSWLREHA